MPVAGRSEGLKQAQLRTSLEAFLPELDNVDAGTQNPVKEPGKITLALPAVGAQVKARGSQPIAQGI